VVAIFSGSETHKLEEIFGSLPVWLAAENGVFVRPPPSHLPVGAQRPGMPVSQSVPCTTVTRQQTAWHAPAENVIVAGSSRLSTARACYMWGRHGLPM
jgi:trehalose-6-phosphatase